MEFLQDGGVRVIDGFILPDSNSRYLTENDLEGLSHQLLSLSRNEIYARHGTIFSNEAISIYFHNRDWYDETLSWDQFENAMLNQYETANVNLITRCENEWYGGSYY